MPVTLHKPFFDDAWFPMKRATVYFGLGTLLNQHEISLLNVHFAGLKMQFCYHNLTSSSRLRLCFGGINNIVDKCLMSILISHPNLTSGVDTPSGANKRPSGFGL